LAGLHAAGWSAARVEVAGRLKTFANATTICLSGIIHRCLQGLSRRKAK